jgi:mRNA interferase RelE/StbE
MAWYRVAYRPEVANDLVAVDKGMAQRLFDKTKWLASNVENLRHEPIHPDLPGLCQYAVGDWRILYSIDKEEQLVEIHLIGKGAELYQREPSQRTHEPTRTQ